MSWSLFRRLAPIAGIGLLLAVSFLASNRGPFPFNGKLVACAGYGGGYGYAGGPPSVTDVNTALGSATGGASVVITGKGFCGGGPTSAVTFGAWSATFTVQSDTTITATAPATSPANTYGVVDVKVTNTLGMSAANAGDRFAYMNTGSASGGGLYTLEGFGGFHPDDSGNIVTRPYWAGFNIARAAHAWPASSGGIQQGFTLDGYGGLAPYGPASPTIAEAAGTKMSHYWNGFDIARDFAFMPDGSGGVVLDGNGGLHPFAVGAGAAPTVAGYSYFGFDVAIKVVIAADGKGGYTLDAYGGVHPFGLNGNAAPAAPTQTGYWSWRAAADMALIPGQAGGYAGYTLDKYGGTHPFATGTLPAALTTSYFGFNIARGISFLTGSSTDGYTMDGYGGPHPFGNAPALHSFPYWAGSDVATEMFGF